MSDTAHTNAVDKSRLSILQAAWVVARRDFVAILFSRAFFFFLLGPLFPVVVGALAGGIGSEVQREAVATEIGLAMSPADSEAMLAANDRLARQIGTSMPRFVEVEGAGEPGFSARNTLESKRGNLAAIVGGTPSAPRITGTEGQVAKWQGRIALVAAATQGEIPETLPSVSTDTVATTAATNRGSRIQTAQGAQMLLFLLTMLLAGMVLSNLVEEKANKIIEILAAAIPMDAVFLGKLFAMLGVSFVGIAVWGAVGGGISLLAGGGALDLPAPAVGWPLFVLLGIAYFAMGYLLLGSLFLTIGAMASTVREVQTLSMPVTMMQLLVFFLAAYAMTQPGTTLELAVAAFPLSSPFAMLARAAQFGEIWPHLLALAWQALWVAIIVKLGATLFRKRVMKSGGAGRVAKRRGLRSLLRNDQSRIAT